MTVARRVAARTAVALVVLAATGAAGSLAAAPAAAAPAPRMMVSSDGETWEARLDSSLFGPDLLLVPGSRAAGTFWVKNLAADGAVLDARLVDVDVSSAEFASHLSVSASTPATSAGSSSTASAGGAAGRAPVVAGSCGALLSPVPLSSGQEAAVTVDVLLASAAAEGTAGQSLRFGVLLTLRDDAVAPSTDAALDRCPTGGPADGSTSVVAAVGSGSGPGRSDGSGAVSGADGPTDGVVPGGSAPVAGAGASRQATGGAGGGAGGEGDVRHRDLAAAPPFLAVALQAPRLPLVVAALALLAGAFVAVGRKRPDDGQDDDAEPATEGRS
jgi:hypothetical protein